MDVAFFCESPTARGRLSPWLKWEVELDRVGNLVAAFDALEKELDGGRGSESELIALSRLRESGKTAKIWLALDSRMHKAIKYISSYDVLSVILKSFSLVHAEQSDKKTQGLREEFKQAIYALHVLQCHYGKLASVDPLAVNVFRKFSGPGGHHYRFLWNLREMEADIRFRYDLDSIALAEDPVVQESTLLTEQAMEFACCLTFYMEKLYKRSYLEFSLAITEVLFRGVELKGRTLQLNRARRKEALQVSLEESDSTKTLPKD